MQCIEHSYQGLVLPSLKWKRAFPSELKLYFTTSPSFFQAHFLSPSSVMFLTWFQTSELDSQYSTPSRWLSANSSLIALFYVVVKVELLAHHLLSWVTGDERRDNEPRKQRAGQWGTDISRSAACHVPSSRVEEMAAHLLQSLLSNEICGAQLSSYCFNQRCVAIPVFGKER